MAEPLTKLKAMREERGWTQTYLAYEMHTTKQAVSAWETGERNLTMKSAKRLAEVLDCKISDIMD